MTMCEGRITRGDRADNAASAQLAGLAPSTARA